MGHILGVSRERACGGTRGAARTAEKAAGGDERIEIAKEAAFFFSQLFFRFVFSSRFQMGALISLNPLLISHIINFLGQLVFPQDEPISSICTF